MIDLFGTKHLLVFGALLTGLSTTLMACFGTETSLVSVLTALFLLGAGLGLYFTAGNTAMMQASPQKDLAVASGVYMMFMMLGNTLSVVLAANVTVIFGRAHLLESLKDMAFSPQQHQELVDVIGQVEHTASQLVNFAPNLIPSLLESVDKAFVYGVMLNMVGGTLLALFVTLLTAWGVKKDPSHAATQKAKA